jgi:hypothetical protein
MPEQYYPMETFRFLYETRLRKMGFDAPHIAEDLRLKLSLNQESFNLEPVEKNYPDSSTLTLTVTNIDRDKNEEFKNKYYLNGPIEVQYKSGEGELIKAFIPLDNQQGPDIDSIKNIMDGNTPYLTVNTKNYGSKDKMFILTSERDEAGFQVVRTYGANIEKVNAEFRKLPLVGISERQKEFLFNSIMKGNIHKTTLRNVEGNREDLFIQASRSNDILIRDEQGMSVSLNKSGLERVTKMEQELTPVNSLTVALVNKQDRKEGVENGTTKKTIRK